MLFRSTVGQQKYVNSIRKKDIVFGIGPAGTGKTYITVSMAVNAFKNKDVQKIILARPAVEAGESLAFFLEIFRRRWILISGRFTTPSMILFAGSSRYRQPGGHRGSRPGESPGTQAAQRPIRSAAGGCGGGRPAQQSEGGGRPAAMYLQPAAFH